MAALSTTVDALVLGKEELPEDIKPVLNDIVTKINEIIAEAAAV